MPGDTRAGYEHAAQARQILNDAEDDLRNWRLEVAPEDTNFAQRNEPVTKNGAVSPGEPSMSGGLSLSPRSSRVPKESEEYAPTDQTTETAETTTDDVVG